MRSEDPITVLVKEAEPHANGHRAGRFYEEPLPEVQSRERERSPRAADCGRKRHRRAE